MSAILKALGLTIWGLIATGLLAIFVFVGYEAAVKLRAPSGALVDDSSSRDPSERGQIGPSGTATSFPTSQTNDTLNASVPLPSTETTRTQLLDAIHIGNYESAIVIGHKLADENAAVPGDLSIVAQSYVSIGNCASARLWAKKAQDAFQAAGVVPDGILRSVILCCGPGFEKYELAITSIERGLKKGGIVHLDEAYVYLGLSKQAVGDIDGARNAFSKLKDVPGVSPRVLRLWALYAETQLTSENLRCPSAGRTNHDSTSINETKYP